MERWDYRGAAEMLDSFLDTPPTVGADQFEHYIGHVVATHQIDASEGMRALVAYAEYVDDGEPKMVK